MIHIGIAIVFSTIWSCGALLTIMQDNSEYMFASAILGFLWLGFSGNSSDE